MHYVLLAALAAFLVPGYASVGAERGASLSGNHPGLQLFAQGMPGSVYKSSQPNPQSNAEGDLA